ncbi:hypothetical protein MMC09_002181 [Bachmanniomyces sp. S44760]|nr:hypothetical protein [Bachmanniomyces sp. S44760]
MFAASILQSRSSTGVSNGQLPLDATNYCLVAAATAVAWTFTIELNITVWMTFRRHQGLYFWALVVSSWGCFLHALAFVLKFLVGVTWLAYGPFVTIGWITMVTGQALVLYSRLHLVCRDRRILRYVLWLIIFDALALHIPTTVFTWGSLSPDGQVWVGMFNVMERVQLTGFCVQECIISTVYLWATVKMMRSIYHTKTKQVMWQLIFINSICIGMDIILACLEYTNQYVAEAAIKPMLYIIKLKLEFAVLNQLLTLSKAGLTDGQRFDGTGGHRSTHLSGSQAPPDKPTKLTTLSSPETVTNATVGPRGGKDNTGLVPTEIYKTQVVDVTTEPNNGAGEHRGHGKGGLMGTTEVRIPGRSSRNMNGVYPTRGESPSESEKEIFGRHSTDREDNDSSGSGLKSGFD